MRKILSLLLMALIAASGRAYGSPWSASAVSLDEGDGALPTYVRILEEGEDADSALLSDSLFYEISGKAHFKVNRTRLDITEPFIVELVQRVLPLAQSRGWRLEAVELRGASSPEGPYRNNVRLSVARAGALHDFLQARLDSIDLSQITTTKTIATDYPYLLWLLERDGDFAAPYLREIMQRNGENSQRIEAELKALYGGRVWNRLLRDYFPRLRTAMLVLNFSREKEDATKVPLMVGELDGPWLAVAVPDAVIGLVPTPRIVERRHAVSVGTNVLYDGFYMPNYGMAPMPNVQIEVYPKRGNFTFLASFLCPFWKKWDNRKFFEIRDYHLEARRYFRPGLHHTGPYLGVYVNANAYSVAIDPKKGWRGEGLGGAVKAGWALQLGDSRWRVDFHVAAGCYFSRFDRYVYGNPITGVEDGNWYYDYTGLPADFKKRARKLRWFGPTEVGVTFTYDVLFYRERKGGASFLRKEVLP